jgi:hypothetical protein
MDSRRQLFDLTDESMPDGFIGWINTVAIAPDGRHVAGGGDRWKVWVWDIGGEVAATYDATSTVMSVAFVNDGRDVAIGLAGGEVLLWSWQQPTEPITLLAKHTGAAFVGTTEDGARLATAGGDGQVWVWDLETKERLLNFRAHDGDILDVGLSGDGRHLVTASSDRTAHVWDVDTGSSVVELVGHAAPVTSAAFADDGTRIVTGATDGTVGVWDVTTGRELFLAPVHGDYTNAVMLISARQTETASDHRLVTAGDDRLVRIFTCETCGEIEDIVEWLEERIAAVPAAAPFMPVEMMSTLDIVAGTCLGPIGDESITQISPVSCDEPHEAEVYAVLQLPDPPGGEIPQDIFVRSDQLCRDGYFEDYVGVAPERSAFSTSALAPTAESWERGGRKVICELFLPAGLEQGSARDSRR